MLINSSNAQNKNCMNVVILKAADSENPVNTRDFNDYFYVENNQICSNKDKKPFSGEIKIIYLSGKTFAELYYTEGIQNGTQYYYYENGKKQSVFNKSDGTTIWEEYYYENGNIRFSIIKVDTNLYNNIYYYQTGEKESEGNTIYQRLITDYSKDLGKQHIKTGFWTTYYKNGQIMSIGEWGMTGKGGEINSPIGEWKYYDEEGIEINESER
ncbi:hypothetical protein FACS189464_2200 [Bacteroidia bacterium]|nr:hypothetical protein FACS189464_2200 [Bacteroidia bacterium]